MKSLINFYNNLDALNLIMFWGIIIVIILLIIFTILLINKNKKIKQQIKENNDSDIAKLEIPLIKQSTTTVDNIKSEIKNETKELDEELKLIKNETNQDDEEKHFVAEEHVASYNQNNYHTPLENQLSKFSDSSQKELSELKNNYSSLYNYKKPENKIITTSSPIAITDPYKKESINKSSEENIPSQKETNPQEDNHIQFQNKINHELISSQNNNQESNTPQPDKTISSKYNPEKEISPSQNEQYLKEVSHKLANAKELDGINRTQYEIKQEEDAIISYEELMRKKDSIQIIDEEDAVISIEELTKLKQQEKLYNLTEEEENEQFIKELKNFRHDL